MPRLGAQLTLLLGLCLAACNPQTDASYSGEPKLTIRGVIVNAASSPRGSAEPTLVWTMPDADFEAVEAKRVLVRHATFDGTFELVVVTEPPHAALYLFEEERRLPPGWVRTPLSIGFIGARSGSQLIAVAPNHVVAFLAEDAPPGSCAERFLGGPLLAGYHLLRGENRTEKQAMAERKACEAIISSEAPASVRESEDALCWCATRAQARLWPAPSTDVVPMTFGATSLNVFELPDSDVTTSRILPEE